MSADTGNENALSESRASDAEAETTPRIGIVGAGITGLSLTHSLRNHGVEPITFEARDRPGGVVNSQEVDGHTLEVGPQRLRLSGPVAELVDELGLAPSVVEADSNIPLYVYARNDLRRVPLSLRTFLTTDLLSWRAKLRLLKEPLTESGKPSETAADLFTRKFGRETYENLIGPLFGGIYGSDPARMPARHALAGLMRLEASQGSLLKPAVRRLVLGGESAPAIAFESGNEQLPQAMYEANRDHIHLDTPVETIREVEDGFELVADGEAVNVDDVVVTVSAPAAAELLSDVAPDASCLADLTYNPLAMVYLRADHDRAGLGYQVRHGESLRTLGVSWNGSAFGHGDLSREGVHTCFLGGMADGEILEQSDDFLGEIAREEFEAVMGCSADVIDVVRPPEGFPAYDDTWDALEDLNLPDGIHLATNYTSRMGVPSRVRLARQLASRLANGR